MNLSTHILNDIPIQNISQKIGILKEMFNELTLTHIPIEKDGFYIGCISENDLRCFDEEKHLEDYRYALTPFFIKEKEQLLNILKVFANHDTNLLPVLEEETNSYLGYLELNDIMGVLDDTPFFSEEGNIMVVEKRVSDFSFSEISQIVESNKGNLYGAYMSKMSNDIAQITIKTSLSNMNEILQTLRRYGYKIISEHQEDSFLQNLKQRSEYLNKYLNI